MKRVEAKATASIKERATACVLLLWPHQRKSMAAVFFLVVGLMLVSVFRMSAFSSRSEITIGVIQSLQGTSIDKTPSGLPLRSFLVHRIPDGGAGNQVEATLAELKLAQENNLEYVLPHLMKRTNYSEGIPPEDVWDIQSLLKVVRKIHTRVPPECSIKQGGKVDIFYMEGANPILLQRPSNIRFEPPPRGTLIVQKKAFPQAIYRNLREDAIGRLVNTSSDPQAGLQKQSHICIMFSGRYSDRTKEREMAPYLRPSRALAAAVRRWPLMTLALVHLRYHEHSCKIRADSPEPARYVCIAGRSGESQAVLQKWVKVEHFVNTIERLLVKRNLSQVYVTRSMYMPNETWSALERTFGTKKKIVMAQSAAAHYAGEWLNIVERQLATEANLFVAEKYSSWSDTVISTRNESRTDIVFVSDLFGDS
jgi:hypothetical protein